MAVEAWLQKSSNNFDCCMLIEKQSPYYDAAMNRLYYSIFHKLQGVIEKLNFDVTHQEYVAHLKTLAEGDERPGYHDYVIGRLISQLFMDSIIDYSGVTALQHIASLRKYRNQADYKYYPFSKSDLVIAKGYYESASDIIDNILSI